MRHTAIASLTRFEAAIRAKEIIIDSLCREDEQLMQPSLSLRESRTIKPGDGPPRAVTSPNLPLRGRVNDGRGFKTHVSGYEECPLNNSTSVHSHYTSDFRCFDFR